VPSAICNSTYIGSADIGSIGAGVKGFTCRFTCRAFEPPVHPREAAVEFRGELYTFVHVDHALAAVSGGDQRRRGLQTRSLQRSLFFISHETGLSAARSRYAG